MLLPLAGLGGGKFDFSLRICVQLESVEVQAPDVPVSGILAAHYPQNGANQEKWWEMGETREIFGCCVEKWGICGPKHPKKKQGFIWS